jgi:hypothetical protein
MHGLNVMKFLHCDDNNNEKAVICDSVLFESVKNFPFYPGRNYEKMENEGKIVRIPLKTCLQLKAIYEFISGLRYKKKQFCRLRHQIVV